MAAIAAKMASETVMERCPGRPRLVQFCKQRSDVEGQANVCGEWPELFFSILRILFVPQIQAEIRLVVSA